VRPGLALVGTVLLVLALAAVVLVTFNSEGEHTVQQVWTIPNGSLPGNGTEFALLQGANVSSGELTVSWEGSVPTGVRLYEAPGCRIAAPTCIQGPAAHTWPASRAGTWSTSGALVFPYLVVWNTSSPVPGSWGFTAVESVTTSLAPAFWEEAVLYATAAALAIVGAMALFLGLFLRGGAFAGPARLVSRSADDVREIAGPPRPPP
jgi:hypothetical protein